MNNRLINTASGGAFDVANFTPVNYFSLTGGGDVIAGTWSPNGLHYYVQQSGGTIGFYQYTASTAWDVTSLSYANYGALSGSDYSAGSAGAGGVGISNDGVYFWTNRREWNGSSFTCGTFRWTLSTPYNISTAGSRVNFFTSGNNKTMGDSNWYNGGSVYHVHYGDNEHRAYNCPTPYSLSGATTLYSPFELTQSNSGFDCTPDGLFYVWVYATNDDDNMTFNQFPLTTPYDLTTRTTTTNFSYLRTALPSPPSTVRQAQTINFSTDGTKAYYLSGQGRVLVEFDTNAVF
jgi:hypothetical protein